MRSAWWISGRERPADLRAIGFVQTLTVVNETTSFGNATIVHRFASRAFWQTLSSDIFAGQIIASLIVLIFVAVFLLREWISQNARPGVFEEEDIAGIPPQDPIVPHPPPLPAQDVNARLLAPQRQVPLDLELEGRRQPRIWRPHRAIPANARFEVLPRHIDDEHLELLRDPVWRPQNHRADPFPAPPLPAILPPENLDTSVSISKGKAKEDDAADSGTVSLDVRRRMRRRYDEGHGNGTTECPSDAGPSLATASNIAPSSTLSESDSGRSSAIDSSPFEFTFRIPANANSEEDIREPVPELPVRSLIALQEAMLAGAPIPDDEPRRRSIVFSDLPPRTPTPRSTTPDIEVGTDLKPPLDSSLATSSDFSFIHLPMSNNTLAAEDSLGSSSLQDTGFSESSTITYPLEPLTDSLSGSMGAMKMTSEEVDEEFEHYFRDPQPTTPNSVGADNDHPDVPHDVVHTAEHDPIVDGEERPPVEAGLDDEDDSEDEDGEEPVFWDADADREDDEDEDDDPVDIGDFNVPDNRPVPQPQLPAQAPVEQPNEGVDELEAAVEDDMEGALEGRHML